MFGHRFFGQCYFGQRFFGESSGAPVEFVATQREVSVASEVRAVYVAAESR